MAPRVRYRYAIVNGVRIRYLDYGRGPSILFIHGLGGNIESWIGVLNRMPQRYRLVALDLRGFGSSQRPSSIAGIEEFADDVEGLADYLGLGRLMIVGFSMGGIVGLEAYRRLGEIIEGLVLVSTLHVLPEAMMQISSLLLEKGTRAWEDIVPRLLYRLRKPSIVSELVRVMSRNDPMYLAGIIEELKGVNYESLLERVDREALTIVGDRDEITPPREVSKLASKLSKGRLVIIRDAGHLLPLEAPQELATAISEFASKIWRN